MKPILLINLILYTGCSGDSEKEEEAPRMEGDTQGDCIDGEDNDGDGAIDCDDLGCMDKPACENVSDTDVDDDTDVDTDTDTDDDTDDTDEPQVDPAEEDNDGDGHPVSEDCNDSDPNSTIIAEDADCDGILTANDCDDSSPSLLTMSEDQNCNGVRDADECEFATEIPYDGIDSNCDGLEYLNDQDFDGVPDSDEDFNVSDDHPDLHNGSAVVTYDIPSRLGVECYGEAMVSNGETVYFLLCDNDEYWPDANAFCQDNGYDSLATFHSYAEMEHAQHVMESFLKPNGAQFTDSAMIGYTRGPACPPASSSSPYPSFCGSLLSNFYWLDDPYGAASWNGWVQEDAHWADTDINSNEHCGQLVYGTTPSGNLYGFWNVFCEYDSTIYWSRDHDNSRPALCMKRQ